jgi:hypothetical protein
MRFWPPNFEYSGSFYHGFVLQRNGLLSSQRRQGGITFFRTCPYGIVKESFLAQEYHPLFTCLQIEQIFAGCTNHYMSGNSCLLEIFSCSFSDQYFLFIGLDHNSKKSTRPNDFFVYNIFLFPSYVSIFFL